MKPAPAGPPRVPGLGSTLPAISASAAAVEGRGTKAAVGCCAVCARAAIPAGMAVAALVIAAPARNLRRSTPPVLRAMTFPPRELAPGFAPRQLRFRIAQGGRTMH